MLGIIICEDNDKQRERIRKIVENLVIIENSHAEIRLDAKTPQEVLKYLEDKQETNLYLLDVDLDSDMNGMTLAAEIRRYDPRGFIVFITSHIEMSYLTFVYKVEAMDYIIKDNNEVLTGRIKACLENALERYGNRSGKNNNEVFTVKIGDKIENIEYKDIMYFETSYKVHKIILYCTNRIIEFYGQMKEVEKLLDHRFHRCHRAFIVNKDNIQQIDKSRNEAVMKNGQRCCISIRQIVELSK